MADSITVLVEADLQGGYTELFTSRGRGDRVPQTVRAPRAFAREALGVINGRHYGHGETLVLKRNGVILGSLGFYVHEVEEGTLVRNPGLGVGDLVAHIDEIVTHGVRASTGVSLALVEEAKRRVFSYGCKYIHSYVNTSAMRFFAELTGSVVAEDLGDGLRYRMRYDNR